MKKNLAIIFLVILFGTACSSGKHSKPKKPALKVATDKVDAFILQQETDNIPYWVREGASHRILVRVSFSDGLMPIGDKAVNNLKDLADREDLQGLLKEGDAFNQAASYNSGNMVTAANKLGIVDEVYWVVPEFDSITAQDLGGFKKYLKGRMPDSGRDIDAIKLNGAVAEGKIGDIPIKITSLLDLPKVEKPVLLQVDLSFFSNLYKDEKETKILSLVSAFINTLKEKNISADVVTISLSNASGVPLKMRFLGGYLSQLLKNPAMTNSEPPALWSERADAWKIGQTSPRQAIPVYKNIIKENPGDAATIYDLAEASFQSGDMDSSKKELADAARIDPGYALGFRNFAFRLQRDGKKEKADAFLEAARSLSK